MGIKAAQDAIKQRREVMAAIPEADRSDFVRGFMSSLEWCAGEIERGIKELMPPGRDEDEVETYDDDDPPVSMIVPARYATTPCVPEKTHAYLFNTPERGRKQCKWCGDVQRMAHGERIAASRRVKKEGRHEIWGE